MIAALRMLLDEGLVQALDVLPVTEQLGPVPSPRQDDASLRRYWFRPTDKGKGVAREGEDLLDAYYSERPT